MKELIADRVKPRVKPRVKHGGAPAYTGVTVRNGPGENIIREYINDAAAGSGALSVASRNGDVTEPEINIQQFFTGPVAVVVTTQSGIRKENGRSGCSPRLKRLATAKPTGEIE